MTPKATLYSTIILVAGTLLVWPVAQAETVAEVKSDSLKYLQELRSQNVRRLREIDQTLNQKREEPATAKNNAEMNQLKTAQNEHVLRQKFLDRLILRIDTKFIGGDMKEFLQKSLTDMAKIDKVDGAESAANSSGMWKFMTYAADAIGRLPEQKENILSFLEGYMNRSVSNPEKPEDYLSSRNYTNGATSEAGTPISRDKVGAIADRRIKESESKSKTAARAAVTEDLSAASALEQELE